jgi:hypothetical protein
MPDVAFDTINDALDRCSDLGFEMAPGFSTHWAMGSETMIQLGRPELVSRWVDLYRDKHLHYPRPDRTATIDPADEQDWRRALGDFGRAGDWQDLFERELQERPWREVLAQWWARLIPGVAAGLTHGLIRTTHAVRSLAASSEPPSVLQLRELATGLSYWAGRYVEQPAAVALLGDRRLPELLASIPRLDQDNKIKLHEKGLFLHMPGVPAWEAAVTSLAPPADLRSALSAMTLSFAQVNLAHPDQFPVPLIHTVTAPAALRIMLPHLPVDLHLPSYIAVWQASAALLTSFAPPRPTEVEPPPEQDPSAALPPGELAERAVEHGDEHAMKYTEACMREYAINPDPRYLLAAEHMLGRLPRYYRDVPRPHSG